MLKQKRGFGKKFCTADKQKYGHELPPQFPGYEETEYEESHYPKQNYGHELTPQSPGHQVAEYEESLEKALEMVNRLKELQIWQEENKTSGKPETSKEILDDYAGAVIDFEELDIRQRIGHGGFGDVHFAKWKGTVVAVKKLRVQRVHQKRLRQFKEEICIFCKLEHPNVIKFLGACIVTPNICMVMEFMEASLYDKIHIDEHEFSEEEKTSIVRHIASGLAYLHSKDIAHCDVKSSNILIKMSEPVIVKITDFGLSMMKNDAETSSSSKMVQNVGTPRYSAPEVLRGDLLKADDMKKADMYSYGLLVFEIFSEEEPFSDMNAHQLRRHVGEGNHTPSLSDVEMNNCMVLMVQKCWERTASERPTAREFLDSI